MLEGRGVESKESKIPDAPIAPDVTPKRRPKARKSSGLIRRARKIHFWRITTTIPVTTTMTTVWSERNEEEVLISTWIGKVRL
jgi:hypothetical protein